MRIGIIGAGAIGSVVGGLLTKAGHDVTLVDQWPQHVEKMRTEGLTLSGTCGDHLIRVNAIHIHEMQRIAEPFEAAFVAVKSYDTEWATALAIQYLRQPDGVVVDFQNGINDHRVASVAGKERTLGCVITIGAGMYEPAHAMRTDNMAIGFKIGELDGKDSARARRLAEVMSAVATTKVTTNLFGERWSKLAVNCMANPLAGLSGYGSAEVRSQPEPSRIAIHVAAEAIRVGGASGYEVEPIYGIIAKRFVDAAEGRGYDEVAKDIAASAKSLSGGRPSLLQDVMRGRRTEIEYLNGYVCTEGRRLGVPTPVNDAVVKTVLSYKVGALTPDPKNLAPITAVLPKWGDDGPMSEVEEFLASVLPRLKTADTALHNGDPRPRQRMWARNSPVTLFGAVWTASGWAEVGSTFEALASRFTNCGSFEYDVIAADVKGELGYIVGIERTTVSLSGAPPQAYQLRVTTILRREEGEWRVVHRHGDPMPDGHSARTVARLAE